MKKQILKMFQSMNEDLFDALPSMLLDEQLFEDGKLDEALAGPQPYVIASTDVGGETFYDGMRVAALSAIEYEKDGCNFAQNLVGSCKITISEGKAGTLAITQGGNLRVSWESDSEGKARDVAPEAFQVVPHEYGTHVEGVIDSIGSTATKWGRGIGNFFGSAFHNQQSNLAEMLSGSLTKWVVCGVAEDANYEELDQWLGTEDEAFQEHVREAYAKWTATRQSCLVMSVSRTRFWK